jgi:hypothetical protein
MNMKMNLNLNQIIKVITRLKGVLITLAATALLAYTAYQISLINSVGADQTYLAAQKDKLTTIQLKSDPKTIQAIRNLQTPGDNNVPIQLGKSNPFTF